jgi:hypothetical protein
MRRKPQAVAAGGAGAAAGKTQRFRCGSVDVVLPIGAVQQLPLPGQAAVVLCICAALAGSVWACVTLLLPGLELVAAPAMRLVRMAWPLWGGAYAAIGVLHFTCAEDFRAIVPPWGAWGVWWIPGSAAFHVAWSGAKCRRARCVPCVVPPLTPRGRRGGAASRPGAAGRLGALRASRGALACALVRSHALPAYGRRRLRQYIHVHAQGAHAIFQGHRAAAEHACAALLLASVLAHGHVGARARTLLRSHHAATASGVVLQLSKAAHMHGGTPRSAGRGFAFTRHAASAQARRRRRRRIKPRPTRRADAAVVPRRARLAWHAVDLRARIARFFRGHQAPHGRRCVAHACSNTLQPCSFAAPAAPQRCPPKNVVPRRPLPRESACAAPTLRPRFARRAARRQHERRGAVHAHRHPGLALLRESEARLLARGHCCACARAAHSRSPLRPQH